MKRNKVNTRTLIKSLIKKYGDRQKAAVALGVTGTYLYMMEAGTVPGQLRFEKIIELVNE